MKGSLPACALALALALTAAVLAEPAQGAPVQPRDSSLIQQMDTRPRASPEHLSELGGEAWMLPLSSALLSPGNIAPRALNMPGLRPFFLLGGDPRSLSWLRENAARLRAMGAVGLAVEVADSEALSRIRATAPDLVIVPVNGDDIAARLRISHYPVLVTATRLDQ